MNSSRLMRNCLVLAQFCVQWLALFLLPKFTRNKRRLLCVNLRSELDLKVWRPDSIIQDMYSRVHKSWNSFFSKILEKPSIVQIKNDTSYKRAGFFRDMTHFPALPIDNIFFMKFLRFGPWVSRINWCEGH